jgi:hypothetical protein
MMNQQLNKQMSELARTTMDNTSKALATLQEQTATMTNMFIDMCPWMPEEGKKAIREWDKPYRKSLEEMTTAMNENYKKLGELFAGYNGNLQGNVFSSMTK